MSNLRSLNQQNPFADLVAAFNTRGADHPFFAAFNPEARDRGPPPSYGSANPPGPEVNTPNTSDEDAPPPLPPPGDSHPPSPPGPHHGPHPGPHHGPHPGPQHGPHPGAHHRGGHCGRGGWGSRGAGRCGGRANLGPWGQGFGRGFDLNKLMGFISQFAPEEARSRDVGGDSSTGGKDFAPDADIFDTADGFVVHVSLPGAKKEDVGVNWNADSSELNVAGVIYRPGDEEFLKTLALDERKVGVFERKVKLGSKESPAQVDSDGIVAKMEDGILIITIPKTEKDFVEVKKVDIE